MLFYFLDHSWLLSLNYSLFIASIILSITSGNPIHSILNLIATFLTGSIFLVILNTVFFALIFLAVYLGAIAILFLFIVMMLDIKTASTRQINQHDWSFFDFIGILFPLILCLLEYKNINLYNIINSYAQFVYNEDKNIFTYNVEFYKFFDLLIYNPHISEIGRYLFTQNIFAFILCGLLLFIAMVGAIVVTVEPLKTKFLYQQDATDQAVRTSNINFYNTFI